MPGTFFGIEIGRSGLAAVQIGQDTTGHNIANAGTPGYSVQSVNQVASDPYTAADHNTLVTPGLIGTGVSISSIQRASDQFLDTQVRDASSGLQNQTAQSDALTQVDNVFGEPSSTGLNAALNSFFNSFQDLANNPESTGVRATTVQQGDALAHVFQGIQSSLTSEATSVANKIGTDVQTINDDSSQIAALNVTIKQQTLLGQSPNDLLDRRGVLLDNLAGLANVSVQNNSDGTVNVSVGNQGLVIGTESDATSLSSLTAKGDLKSGALAGLSKSQGLVAGYQTQLNTLAASVVSQVNAVHEAGAGLDGTTGLAFFTAAAGSEASTLAVNPTLESNPQKLAAAAAPIPPAATPPAGDASNAVLLAGLLTKTVTVAGDPLQGTSLQNYYQQTVSDAGGRAASAKTATQSAQANYTQLTQQRDSVTGVSTDDEMVNMMKYQRAYQASARVVQTMDDMVGTLINNLFSAN